MGNDHSTHATPKGSGVPFVSWKGGGYHFAEPACYRYDRVAKVVTAQIVFTDPPKADAELRNKEQLLGSIVVVERGGRVHFPDIVRKVINAGAVGCIFVERSANNTTQSLFDGFHSSGRHPVAIPVVLLSKSHGDQLMDQKPPRVSIEFFSGDQAIQKITHDDIYLAVATAARAGEVELLKHLLYADTTGATLQNIPKAVALCDAAENGHVDCIEILHGFGVSLDEQKPNGTTALMVACSAGNVEAARALLMYGANVDMEDVHGFTALMVAARDNKLQCLKLLIRKGARINLSRNRARGSTALHCAARGGFQEICNILIESGAQLDAQSPNSTTALMEAARAGRLGCVKLLVHSGANLDAKDREGHNAEWLAHAAGHKEIEDFLRDRAESDSVKNHRRRIEDTITKENSTLEQLLDMSKSGSVSVDILQREITRDEKSLRWLEQPHVIYDVFRLLTHPVSKDDVPDPRYGLYKVQHFCCEIILSYPRRIYCRRVTVGKDVIDEADLATSAGYFKILFNFICNSGPLDDVLLVLFCKVLNHFILHQQLGELLMKFLANDGKYVVPWLVCHIGSDSIRDTLVWLLYCDMSDEFQANIRQSGLFECLFERLHSWQRTLGWGVGTAYQRDSVENICSLINYVIKPPAVYIMGEAATFVYDSDCNLPLIIDQYFPNRHNELFKTLLLVFESCDVSFGKLIDLGYAEIERQVLTQGSFVLHEGGALSIVMCLMATVGYHRRPRDVTSIESLLKESQKALLSSLMSRVGKFVELCRTVVATEERISQEEEQEAARAGPLSANGKQRSSPSKVRRRRTAASILKSKGTALLHLISFFKRCVFLQSAALDAILAQAGLMPCVLACYGAHPSNSILHHELTDIVRFVLMDPDQQRQPSCPLLNSMFTPTANILDIVMNAYVSQLQYKGHMTTIANSIFTLINTPVRRVRSASSMSNGEELDSSIQEVVREYTEQNAQWAKFESRLKEQNDTEMMPLGERNAPLCDGCLQLKEFAVEYVSMSIDSMPHMTGYLETLFSSSASHHCRVIYTDEHLSGFLYKKDKIHDHIPIPEPTRVSSFIQFPVPMPFHALTFTCTFFGLCRKCGKLWYCDSLQSANWSNRMKWVIPTSVRKWYSFGVTEGPGSGAHGIQFSTKGYKNFIVLTDTWGRQEQWVHGLEEAIETINTQAARKMDAEAAMAIEIDNEVDNDPWLENPSDEEDKLQLRPRFHTIGSLVAGSNGESSSTDSASSSSSSEIETKDTSNGGSKNGIATRAADVTNPEATSPSSSADPTDKSKSPRSLSPTSKKTIKKCNSERKNDTDLSIFQPDSKRFAEILNNLKRLPSGDKASSSNSIAAEIARVRMKPLSSPPIDPGSLEGQVKMKVTNDPIPLNELDLATYGNGRLTDKSDKHILRHATSTPVLEKVDRRKSASDWR